MKRQLKFPLTLDQALSVWLPRVKPSDRLKIYRRCLSLRPEKGLLELPPGVDLTMIPVPADEVSEIIARRRRGYFTESQFVTSSRIFLRWREVTLSDERKAKAEKAAKARWSKKVKNKVCSDSNDSNAGSSTDTYRRKLKRHLRQAA